MNASAPKHDPVDACALEPIRIPGGIQPHGALVVLSNSNLALLQASANCSEVLGSPGNPDQGCAIENLAPGSSVFVQNVREWSGSGEPTYLKTHALGGRSFHVSGHRTAQGLILEFEPALQADPQTEAPYPTLRTFLEDTEAVADVTDLVARLAHQVRVLTGFNRVMIYRFDEDWHGRVIAEDRDDVLPSYLDLRFPASDIPSQARELYRLNRLRLIPTANYQPAPITPTLCPVDGSPLDLSFAALRSVSPVHLEYMRNMGTVASMSISILIDGELWGLVSCHHAEEKRIDPRTRAACDFLGRIAAQQISARERAAESVERLRIHHLETELVAHLARASTFQTGLVERASQWLGIVNAAGAAIITEGAALTVGVTPSLEEIFDLSAWIQSRDIGQIFSTNSLSSLWPDGAKLATVASGVVAVPISRLHASFIMWFRPELPQTVTWGGDPRASERADASGRLHPRSSFKSWTELVRRRAKPWREAELMSAVDFRSAVVNFVLQHAEERAQLTDELQRSNKELEAFSYSISHDLRAPFRHIAGYAQLLAEEEPNLKPLSHHYLEGISRAAISAGELVDDLLHFSQLGRANLSMSMIDMQKVVEEVKRSLEAEASGRLIEWEIGVAPPSVGDASLVRQVLFNLVENAVKYTREKRPGRVKIWGVERTDDVLYTIEDNGVGFDMAYAAKLFQVFQRLHRPEDFEGTGIGLALAKRIVDRHGGAIEARGEIGKGASFSFSLPKRLRGAKSGDA